VVLSWGQEKGVPVKDLLPDMDARSGGNFHTLFLSCDGHWTPKGSKVAAEILEPWLGQLYATPAKN